MIIRNACGEMSCIRRRTRWINWFQAIGEMQCKTRLARNNHNLRRNMSVIVVIMLRTWRPGVDSGKRQDFYFSTVSRLTPEPTHPHILKVIGLFPRGKVVRAWTWPLTYITDDTNVLHSTFSTLHIQKEKEKINICLTALSSSHMVALKFRLKKFRLFLYFLKIFRNKECMIYLHHR